MNMIDCKKCGQGTAPWVIVDQKFPFCYDCWAKGIKDEDLKK